MWQNKCCFVSLAHFLKYIFTDKNYLPVSCLHNFITGNQMFKSYKIWLVKFQSIFFRYTFLTLYLCFRYHRIYGKYLNELFTDKLSKLSNIASPGRWMFKLGDQGGINKNFAVGAPDAKLDGNNIGKIPYIISNSFCL